MKKYTIPILICGGLAIIIVVLLFLGGQNNAWQSVPQSAVAVLEIENWNQLSDKLNVTSSGRDFKRTPLMNKLSNEVALIEEIFGADKALKNVVSSKRMLVSMHLISAEDYDFLYSCFGIGY